MLLMFIMLIAFVLVLSTLAVIAGTISYLRDPNAIAKRQQYRDNLARISAM